MEGERRVEATRRWVIAVGFWVQGFRLFPWLGVNFFLKDGMGVAASSLQILQASANLPMVAKPLLGLLSDAVPIRGHRRLPYVAIGGIYMLPLPLPLVPLLPSPPEFPVPDPEFLSHLNFARNPCRRIVMRNYNNLKSVRLAWARLAIQCSISLEQYVNN